MVTIQNYLRIFEWLSRELGGLRDTELRGFSSYSSDGGTDSWGISAELVIRFLGVISSDELLTAVVLLLSFFWPPFFGTFLPFFENGRLPFFQGVALLVFHNGSLELRVERQVDEGPWVNEINEDGLPWLHIALTAQNKSSAYHKKS